MTDAIAGILAVAGCAFIALAGIGVARFPDLYARMHAATKAPTLGILLVATAATLVVPEGRAKLVLAVGVIFVTAPVASHLLGRSAYRASGIDLRLDERDDLAEVLDATDRPDGAAPDAGRE